MKTKKSYKEKQSVNFAKFFFELGQLKILRRSGWSFLGVKNAESVADHSFRASLIGYLLARKKKLNAERVALMLLFHDVPEARLGDTHKVSARYVDMKKYETQVINEQAQVLGKYGDEYKELMAEFNAQKTPEAKLAKQVDFLECAIQAREYLDGGYIHAKEWIEKTGKHIIDKDCRAIYRFLKKKNASYWWKGLKKI